MHLPCDKRWPVGLEWVLIGLLGTGKSVVIHGASSGGRGFKSRRAPLAGSPQRWRSRRGSLPHACLRSAIEPIACIQRFQQGPIEVHA
jgi:hypothetical protein